MSQKNDDLQSAISDPQWLPSHWDRDAATFDFVRLPRERHGDFTFLADEYLGPAHLPTAKESISELHRETPTEQPAASFIFHSAFCCSTLIARALDVPGAAMALKEPQILNELAEAARSKALTGEVFGLAIKLLSRPFAPGERLVIKPSNVVNVLALALMNANAGSRAIFLYAPLSRFLGSVAGKGLWGRRWARRLFIQLLGDTGLRFGFAEAEQFELSDLQIAALAWLMHHSQGAALIRQFPRRVRTLDSEEFLAKRSETLQALAVHFQFQLGSEQAEQIAAGPVFATHSKELGRKFDPEQSLEPRPPMAIVEEEIDMVTTWAGRVADHVGVPIEFPKESALLSG
jgi:hypothetical protein